VSAPDLREVAEEDPDAVRRIAERAGGDLEKWLKRVLEEADAE